MAGLFDSFFQQPGGGLFGDLQTYFATQNPQTPRAQAILQQRAMQAQYQALQQAGVPQAEAAAGAMNPRVGEMIAQKYFGTPTTANYTNPQTQIQGTAVFDPVHRQWLDMASQQPLGQAQPTFAGQGQQGPFTAGAIPAGVDPAKYRQAEAGRIAEEQQKLRDMGSGSIEFLPDALRTLDKIKQGNYNEAIGPIEGSDWFNQYVRGPIAGAAASVGITGPQQNLSAYNQYKADVQRLSSRGLKAQFGARPTNIEVDMNKQTFGNMQSADAPTAANILSERIRAAYESLGRSIQAGLISPNAIPKEIMARAREFNGQPQQAAAGSFTQDQLLAEARRRGLIK